MKLRLPLLAALKPCGATLLAIAIAHTLASAPIQNVLIVGNSITEHAPAPELGWQGRHGMAATRPENDYAHRVLARIADAEGMKPTLVVHAKGGGTIPGKLEDADRLSSLAVDANLIIVQLGENDHKVTPGDFGKPYDELLALLHKANPGARLVCTGVWAPPSGNGDKDRLIRALCQKHDAAFADLSAANADPANRASSTGLWQHRGVNWHPSDAGMEAYATAIWNALNHATSAHPVAAQFPSPSTTATRTSGQILFTETFSAADSLERWAPRIGTLTREGPPESPVALKVLSTSNTSSTLMRRPLSHEDLAGRTITLSARVKTADISAPPKPWNGVKIMLHLYNAEGQVDSPQIQFEARPELAWTEFSLTRAIPDNTVGVDLLVGLEKVTGTVWVTDIKITSSP